MDLSRSKNSAFRNNCFADKKIQPNGEKGYYNGSYSEIEVAQYKNWTSQEIYERGMKMLKFMNERWNLGVNENDLKELLFLSFVRELIDVE